MGPVVLAARPGPPPARPRVLCPGEDTTATLLWRLFHPEPADVEQKLRPPLERIFPRLAGVRIEHAWSGNFALSFSRVPQIGRLGPSTYFAHGYSGHGVTGSHLFGRILAEAVDGDLARFDTFAAVRWIPFPGGRALRVPYSVLGSYWYGLRDALGV